MQQKRKDYIIIGFALFSMFFGAGNLIFPPHLGKEIGPQYIWGIIGFIITGVGIPLLGILACIKADGNFENLSIKVGKKFSYIYSIALFLLIGPLLAIPRTAATTYEIAIKPNFTNFNLFIFVVIYFIINLFFVLKPSKVIETLGKYLTPILLIILVLLIVKGIISPIGDLAPQILDKPFSASLIEGYQTMDALASIVFASLIISSVKAKNYKGKEIIKLTIKACLVAIIGLAIVYGGLIILGAHTGGLWEELSNTELLIMISRSVLGHLGTIVIGIAIGIACLTTSIGLLSSGGNFFERISKGKLSYNLNVIVMAVISIGLASIGLDNIVSFSAKLLSIIYPFSIVLIIMNLLDRYIKNKLSYKVTVYVTLIVSILSTLGSIIPKINNIISYLPLSKEGFAWIVPALIAFIISNYFIPPVEEVLSKEDSLLNMD
ncbi:branched-chain amino acid transport system II carrier protein [Clostridium fallax]|uniref:Branched-chain amino acid transport system carrier protein n=1 Tax=Clostridium fallax TaxID=1533 RepID=A0A1M4Y666_9CLOT|nr:branched-chain amino acid transport system II carrier protein [Clostridium fallax]SHF01195.1 branched-chain amino acid:cation transporter, LIVCS family [Clostridium fallax]SQB07461.1 branched chain amino acid ABC transporter carrier protein [Clostridium fallax]